MCCEAIILVIKYPSQIRFCLNAQSRWQQVDGDFDNAEFFANVRGLFFSDSEFAQQWAEETIEWWNMYVSLKYVVLGR